MGKRKGSRKRRRPEDEATSQARPQARTPVSQWSPDVEQPGPEHEEAGPSRLPVIQIPQVPRWADEDEDDGPTQEEMEQASQISLAWRRARGEEVGPSREQVEQASRISRAMSRARGEEAVADIVLPRRSSRNSEEKRVRTARLNTVDQPEIATVPLGTSRNFYISEDLSWPVMNSVADYVVTLGVSSPNKCTPARNRHFFCFNDSEMSSEVLCALNLAVQFCVDKLTKGFSVLVHCAAGVNRSSLVYVEVMKHFMPHHFAREMIDILANAKHAVNESWQTLTNPHFVEHLCREEQEEEQSALDLPSAHAPYAPAGCTNSEEPSQPSIQDLLEGLEDKKKRKRVTFSLYDRSCI